MKKYNVDAKSLLEIDKKWMLDYCDLPTELVPDELMGEYWL